MNVRGKVRLSRRMKTSVGRRRCEGSGEKGAHEQTVMRSWMTRGWREMVLDAPGGGGGGALDFSSG